MLAAPGQLNDRVGHPSDVVDARFAVYENERLST
jgi:hypothetical protein